MDVRKRVLALLAEWEWEADAPLVVGVSGGPDSLALLHLLVEGGLHPAGATIAAHLNHHLRPTSAAEARFVADICEAWNVPFHLGDADVAALARAEGQSLEEAGRRERYRFLAQVARRAGAPAIAVGHNADDQAETVLMHFLRGTGLAGLRGMLPVGPVPEAPELTLLRPLLTTGRDDIQAYCAAHDLTPVIDESNKDTTYFRNRLRHDLLPLLAEYNPQIKERLQHTAAVVAADYDLLQTLRDDAWAEIVRGRGAGWLRVDLAEWRALPLSLRRSTLRHAVWQLRASLRDVSFRPVEQARQVAETGEVGAQATLPGGLMLTVEYDAWRLAEEDVVLKPDLPQLVGEEAPLPVPGRVALAHGWELTATVRDDVDLAHVTANPDPWLAFVDADRVGDLVVRPRRPGESFRPLGMAGHTATVADVMINEKVPARLRARWPIVAGDRHLVWLVGHRLDRRARLTRTTTRVVRLRVAQDEVS